MPSETDSASAGFFPHYLAPATGDMATGCSPDAARIERPSGDIKNVINACPAAACGASFGTPAPNTIGAPCMTSGAPRVLPRPPCDPGAEMSTLAVAYSAASVG